MENALNPDSHKRLTVREMKKEVLSHFYFERGILFTFWWMIKNPQKLLYIYLNEDRKKVFNPFRYLLVGVAISTVLLVNHPRFIAFVQDLQAENINDFNTLGATFNLPIWELFVQAQSISITYQNVMVILSIPVVSWVTCKFFKSEKYNYAEHMVINAFVFGTSYWLVSLFTVFFYFSSDGNLITYGTTAITVIIAAYLYFRIFHVNLFKSLLGFILAYIPVYIVGIVAQMIIFIVLILINI